MSLRVFITGGTSGYGLSLAKLYQSKGHTVGVCGRDLSKIENETFQKFQADVTNKKDMAQAISSFGDVDLLIANAGIAYEFKNQVPDFDYSRKMIDINIHGLLNSVEPVLSGMIERKKGHLAVVSSVAGLNGLPGVSCYAGSKGFGRLMFESFAIDFKEFGIDTSIIMPGWMDTPLARKNPHPMPFVVPSEKAAQITYDALMKKKYYIYFPKRMYFLVRFLSVLPRSVFRYLFSLKILNFSKKANNS